MAVQTEFAIVPEAAELAALERDFAFVPADPARARTLTRQQVEQYNRDGFINKLTFYERAEILAIRRYFDDLLAATLAAGKDSYSISSAHLKHGRVYDILTNPRIVAAVSDLLGDDVVGWGAHFFCKMPGDGKRVAWHQDFSYWPLSASRNLTVWLAIDDVDIANGAMCVLPGTHHHGAIEYRASDAQEGNVLNQTVEDVEQYGEPVYAELAAGQASIHSDLLLHGSEPNTSSRRRCGLTLRYCPAEVRAHLGWNSKGVVVRGVDRDHHWGQPARPAVD